MAYFYYNTTTDDKVAAVMRTDLSIIEFCPNDIANLISELRDKSNDKDADIIEQRLILTKCNALQAAQEIQELLYLAENPGKVGRMTDIEYRKLLKRISKIPERIHNRSHYSKERIVEARTVGIIHHRQENIPMSEMVHVGVRGKFSVDWVREIEDIIGRKWTTIPRIPIHKNRQKPNFAELMRYPHRPDSNILCHGMDIIDKSPWVPSISIVCSHTSLSKLMLHDVVVFHSYLDPEFEKCIRAAVEIPDL